MLSMVRDQFSVPGIITFPFKSFDFMGKDLVTET